MYTRSAQVCITLHATILTLQLTVAQADCYYSATYCYVRTRLSRQLAASNDKDAVAAVETEYIHQDGPHWKEIAPSVTASVVQVCNSFLCLDTCAVCMLAVVSA